MTKFFQLYEDYLNEEWQKNINKVINGVYDHEKLQNHAYNMGITADEFVETMKNNRFAAYILAKDPTKQNIQEKFQSEFINKQAKYEAIRLLPKKNPYKWKLNGISTKTTDAIITINGEEFYCTMKLIKNKGGAQDNQRADAQKYLQIASKLADKRIIALIDDDQNTSNEYFLEGVEDRNKALVFNSESLVRYIR